MYLIINKFIADVPTAHNNGTLVIELDGVSNKRKWIFLKSELGFLQEQVFRFHKHAENLLFPFHNRGYEITDDKMKYSEYVSNDIRLKE